MSKKFSMKNLTSGMGGYIIKRLIISVFTMIIIISINFFLLKLMPGTPFKDEKLTPIQIEMLKDAYGLNDPLPVQYLRYMNKVVLHFDLGTSLKYNNLPVTGYLLERFPLTTKIGLIALAIGTSIGIVLGAFAALYKDSWVDNLTIIIAIIGVSIPSFVLASLMQFYLGVEIKLFPVVYSKTEPWTSIILPVLVLSFGVIATVARFMRTELVEILNSDYILLAHAKGLKKSTVIFKHAIRNSLIPIITVVGPIAINLITGSLVIESIFGVPGLSKVFVDAIYTNDVFVTLGASIVFSGMYIFILLVIDVLYGLVDPRIRVAGGSN